MNRTLLRPAYLFAKIASPSLSCVLFISLLFVGYVDGASLEDNVEYVIDKNCQDCPALLKDLNDLIFVTNDYSTASGLLDRYSPEIVDLHGRLSKYHAEITAYRGIALVQEYINAPEPIGISVDMKNGYVVISQIEENSAAEESGELRVGDRIIGVGQGSEGDIEDVVGLSIEQLGERIIGEKGAVLRLRVIPVDAESETSTTVINIARPGSIQAQKLQEGLALLLESEKLLYEVEEANPMLLPAILLNLFDAYNVMKDYQNAANYAVKSLSANEELFGEMNISIVPSLLVAGDAQRLLGDYEQSVQSLEVSGDAQHVLGIYEQGLQFHSRAVAIVEEIEGKNSVSLIYPLLSLGRTLKVIDRYNRKNTEEVHTLDTAGVRQALEYLKAALVLIGEHYGENSVYEEIALGDINDLYNDNLASYTLEQDFEYRQRFLNVLEATQSDNFSEIKLAIEEMIDVSFDLVYDNLQSLSASERLLDYGLRYLAYLERSPYVNEIDELKFSQILSAFTAVVPSNGSEFLEKAWRLINSDKLTTEEANKYKTRILSGLGYMHLLAGEENEAESYYRQALNYTEYDTRTISSSFLKAYSEYLLAHLRPEEAQVVSDISLSIRYRNFMKDYEGPEIARDIVDIEDTFSRISLLQESRKNEELLSQVLSALNMINSNPIDYDDSNGGRSKATYRDAVDRGDIAVLESLWKDAKLTDFFSREDMALLNATAANSYYHLNDINAFFEYMSIAAEYDEYYLIYLLRHYATAEQYDELEDLLLRLGDVGNIDSFKDCDSAKRIAGGWGLLAWSLDDDNDSQPLLVKASEIFKKIFNMDDESYNCYRDLNSLIDYARIEGSLDDLEAALELAYEAFSQLQRKLLGSFSGEEFYSQATESYYVSRNYLYYCSTLNETPIDEELRFYRDRCQENSLLAVDLSNIDRSTSRVLSSIFKASVPDDIAKSMIRDAVGLRAEIDLLDARISRYGAREDETEEYFDLLLERSERIRNLETIDAQFSDLGVYEEKLFQPSLLDQEELRSLIRPREAIITLDSLGDFSTLSLITRDTIISRTSPTGEQDLRDMVSILRDSLDLSNVSNYEDLPSYDLQVAYDLYEAIFGQFSEELSEIDSISFVSSGVMKSLPLSLLVTENPEADNFDLDSSWAYKKHSFKRLPSLRSLYALSANKGAVSENYSFLGIGEVELGSSNSALRAVKILENSQNNIDTRILMSLPSLPETRKEILNIASHYEDSAKTLLFGEDANEQALRNLDLSSYSTIAFATHGLLSGEIPGLVEPALLLTPPLNSSDLNDGLLTASEIAVMDLNADLVILSACNTNLDEQMNADGLAGLSTAFLYAGVRNLLVTHWSVDTDATAFITTTTIGKYRSEPEMGIDEALRYAIDQTRQRPGWAHPAFWAPFSVIGGVQ